MIKLPAYLQGFSSKVDGSASIRLTTQELQAEDFAELQRNLNKFGWFLFQENPISTEDLPKEDARENWTKSQELRYWITRYATENGIEKDQHYNEQMQKIIDHFKAKVKNKIN